MPFPYSPEEALSFLLDNNLSKRRDMNILLGSKDRIADIYPPYATTLKAKIGCRVMVMTITETFAKVRLCSLLNHTAKCIVRMQNEVVTPMYKY